MKLLLSDKNVLITGANGGIGKALVRSFASCGANVYAIIRIKDPDFENFVIDIREKYNININIIELDLCKTESLKSFIKNINRDKLTIHILVNNAGILSESLLMMTSLDAVRKVFEINFFALYNLTNYISRLMVRQKTEGTIINISSVAAFDGVEGQTAYGATKAGIASLTKSLAKELGRYNIRVNSVAPGLTETPLISNMKPDILEREKQLTYLGRIGMPDEIADVVVFLASNKARYITGQVLRVDGGRN